MYFIPAYFNNKGKFYLKNNISVSIVSCALDDMQVLKASNEKDAIET